MDKELYNIVIETLYHVATATAKGESNNCMDELEQTIILLEVAIDNAAVDGACTDDLENAKGKLIALQNTLFEYATD